MPIFSAKPKRRTASAGAVARRKTRQIAAEALPAQPLRARPPFGLTVRGVSDARGGAALDC
jgi:hypothetical protein